MIEEERTNKSEPATEAEEPEAKVVEDLEELQKALAEAKEKADANLSGWQRAQADFANYKRRSEQEKGEAGKSANAALLLELLPVMDDLERALASIPPEAAEQGWVGGIRLIERKWKAYLEQQGLAPIKAIGEQFDPRFHEALKQDIGKEGTVIQEIQKGYMLGDRVLRPSKVIVGNGEEAETEADRSAEQKDTE